MPCQSIVIMKSEVNAAPGNVLLVHLWAVLALALTVTLLAMQELSTSDVDSAHGFVFPLTHRTVDALAYPVTTER